MYIIILVYTNRIQFNHVITPESPTYLLQNLLLLVELVFIIQLSVELIDKLKDTLLNYIPCNLKQRSISTLTSNHVFQSIEQEIITTIYFHPVLDG